MHLWAHNIFLLMSSNSREWTLANTCRIWAVIRQQLCWIPWIDPYILRAGISWKADQDNIPLRSQSSRPCITNYSQWFIFFFAADINDCVPNPCINGACTDMGTNSYGCVCESGWTGTNCDSEWLSTRQVKGFDKRMIFMYKIYFLVVCKNGFGYKNVYLYMEWV